MNVITLEEFDRELLSDEERLVSSLQAREAAKEALKASMIALRKARITSISNKLLAPYRRFKIEQTIAKYDAMMEKLEKKREKEIIKAEKLQEKEQKQERKQAKADFKTAIRDKRKEDIISFANDTKDNAINFGKEIGSEVSDTFSYIKEIGESKVSRASSFAINVKNSAIKKVKENTTIDLTIKNAIEEVKLRYATNKFNNAVKKREKEEEKAKEQELDDAINFDEGVKIELKSRDVPFSNINEKIQKARKQSSYMGKATNRVVRYFKSKKDNLLSSAHEKALETEGKMIINAYDVMGKVSKSMSEIRVVFNNELSDLKAIVSDRYKDIKRSAKEKMDVVSYAYQDYKDKEDVKRIQKEQDIALKRAQLDSMREALKAVNQNSDIFGDVSSLDVGRSMR